MRSLTTEIENTIVAPVLYSLVLVRLDFDSGTVAWNSGFVDIPYGGKTYIAAGTLSNISQVEEQPGVASASLTVSLSGIKPEVCALVLNEPFLGREAYVYQAFVNADLVFDPARIKLMFTGTMDTISGNLGSSASFSVSLKSRLADWERPRNLQYSDADQRKLYPGDRFMEYIPQISKKKIIWPKAKAQLDPRG